MPLFRSQDRQTIDSLARLTYCNPFDAEFIERQRAILGPDFVPQGSVWSLRAEPQAGATALEQVGAIAERVARDTRERLLKPGSATPEELALYAYIVAYALYVRYAEEFHRSTSIPPAGGVG